MGGINPNAADFVQQFITLVKNLNRHRPEFQRLDPDGTGQWSYWTDGHVLEEELFTIVNSHRSGNRYWYFKKQVFMRILCQSDRRRRRSTQENMDVIKGRLNGKTELFNDMANEEFDLPDIVTGVEMEHVAAVVDVTTTPESADGDTQSGECDASGGSMECSCKEGFFQAADGSCVADDMPDVKSETFTTFVESFFSSRLTAAIEDFVDWRKERQETKNAKFMTKFNKFYTKFSGKTRKCENPENAVDPEHKEAVFASEETDVFVDYMQMILEAKMGDCPSAESWPRRIKHWVNRLENRLDKLAGF